MNPLMRTEKSSRWGAMLLATVVAIVTCLAVANATQTITTPNAAFISYNLTVGASSAAITPATNKPVLVMGCCTVSGAQGIGQVSLLHLPSGGFVWVGLEPYPSGITTKGLSGTQGHHIVYTDSNFDVDIQVASADTILIHNGPLSTGFRFGNVTLIW